MKHKTTRARRALALAVASMALLGAVHAAAAAEPKDKADIRSLIGKTWDKPEAKVVVDPIVVSGPHAVASWTQGERGGRALLRKSDASWQVVVCSGDPLKQASALAEAGIPQGVANRLAEDLAAAEQQTDPERVKLFSTFEGVMRMDGDSTGGHHPHH